MTPPPAWIVHHAECIEQMRTMNSETVHAVIADPPYLIGAVSTGAEKGKPQNWSDMMNAALWYATWIREAWRILRPDGYFISFLNWRSQPVFMKALFDCRIICTSMAVWDKEWIGPSSDQALRPTYEQIAFCAKPGAKMPNRSRSDLFRCKWMAAHMKESDHPAEKPVKLLAEIIELVTSPGGIILDPFTGSGTTGIAALHLGREFIGIEDDAIHHATAVSRITESLQPDLFS